LGTDILRKHVSENFFIDACKAFLDSTCENVVITDVRFENEAQFIKDQGGYVIYITRPGIETLTKRT
jgi:hypothetical protein